MLAEKLIAVTRLPRTGFACICALILTACGGGGGGGSSLSPPAPPPPPPTTVNPSLSISDAIVTEGDAGNTVLQFTIVSSSFAMSGQTVADASVTYTTSSDTATAIQAWVLPPTSPA